MADSQPLPRLSATYDPEARALYVYVRPANGPVKTYEEEDGFNVDIRHDGLVAGFEFLLPGPLEILTDPSTGSSSPYPIIEVRADV